MTKTVATSRLSAADRSATEFYAAMIAPSGARPSVTKRQIAIKSLRAKATIMMRRIWTLKRSQHGPGTMPRGCSLVGSEAKARRVGRAFPCGLGCCRQAIDAPIAIHAAALKKALGQDPDSWRFAACCRRSGRTPPSSGRKGEVHADSADRAKRFDRSALRESCCASRACSRTASSSRIISRRQRQPPTQAVQLCDEMGRQRGGRRPFCKSPGMSASQERRDGLPRTPWVASNAAMRFSMRTRSCTRNSRSRCGRFASSSSTDGTTTVRQAPGSPANLCGQGREGGLDSRPAGRF